jgi:hypothetical protein
MPPAYLASLLPGRAAGCTLVVHLIPAQLLQRSPLDEAKDVAFTVNGVRMQVEVLLRSFSSRHPAQSSRRMFTNSGNYDWIRSHYAERCTGQGNPRAAKSSRLSKRRSDGRTDSPKQWLPALHDGRQRALPTVLNVHVAVTPNAPTLTVHSAAPGFLSTSRSPISFNSVRTARTTTVEANPSCTSQWQSRQQNQILACNAR